MKKRFLNCLALFAVSCILTAVAFGQGTTSRITGIVTDAQKAPVSGATVTIKAAGTGAALTTQSDDNGVYVFDLIQPGTYEVTVEKSGFKRVVSTGNAALVNQPTTVNIALEVGDVSATVTVTGTAEQVQTSSSGNLGGTVEQRTIESLPIVGTRGRNPLDILNFQPGVTTGANTGGGVHVNGSRDRSFNFTLDGIDINESTAGGSNFTPLRPNPESIQEFQIVTSGFTAELGRSSGAQVTFVTRSGGNEFHGNLFEYYQTKGFMARSYAANVNNTAKENFIQHIFGGSFGGPIPNFGFGEGTPFRLLRDKAFFFVNLQMLRANDTLLSTRTVLTSLARQGVFRWVHGGTNGQAQVNTSGNPILPACNPQHPGVPPAGTHPCINSYNIPSGTLISLDPVISSYIAQMPLPNSFRAGVGDGLNTAGYQFNSPQQEKQWDFVSKFDFKVNDKNSLYVRYALGEQNTFGDAANGGRRIFPDTPNLVDTFRTPKNLAINWRSSPTSKFTNEFIAGWSKFGFSFGSPEPDPVYAFTLGLVSNFNSNFAYNARSFRTWQFVDNITFDMSPHVIKAGANIRFGLSRDDRGSVSGATIEGAFDFSRLVNNNFNFGPGSTALPTGNIPTTTTPVINTTDRQNLETLINTLLGRVGNYTQAFVSDPDNPNVFAPGGTRWLFDASHRELDFYLQDTWRPTSNLILDLGFRWEPKFAPRSAGGRPMLVPNKSVVLGAPAANDIRWVEGNLFDDAWGIIMPSLGFAWDPFKKGKTSIRANYRKASDRIGTFLFSSFIFQSTPGNNTLGSNTAFGQGGGLLRQGLPSIAPTGSPATLSQPTAFSTGGITVIDPGLEFPDIHNYTLSFQHEVFGGNVVEVNYIRKTAKHLFGGYNANQVNINSAFGGVPGVSGTFLDAFKCLRDPTCPTTTNNPFINHLMTGSSTNTAGTTQFRSLYGTAITQGSVASVALSVSNQLCTAALITATVCPAGSTGQRLLNVRSNGFFFQPFSQFNGGMFVVDSNDYSDYNGLEIIFRRRMQKGLSFQIGYTYAISKDSRSFDPVFTTVQSGVTTQTGANYPFDNANRDLNYSWSDFDRRHSLLGTYVYELPFGRGKAIGSGTPSILNYMISGWQVAGTIRMTSGRPFTAFSGLFTVTQTVGSTANCNGCPRNLGSRVQGDFDNPGSGLRNWWFDAAARGLFSQPGPGQQGNTPRNYFIGPSYFETDISVLRKFRLTERFNFDLRVDARNLTNTPNFAFPSTVLPASFSQSGYGSSLFGRINADVVNNARRMQFSAKLNF